MRTKRTHRIICEALESRRLLSGPDVAINYLNSNVDLDADPPQVPHECQPSNGGTISWITGVPLHVTGVAAGSENGTTFPEDSDPNAAIKSEWQWNFDVTDVDPSNTIYDKLNGFNAAHIYNNTGTYELTLTVTDQYGAPTTEIIYVDVGAVAENTKGSGVFD